METEKIFPLHEIEKFSIAKNMKIFFLLFFVLKLNSFSSFPLGYWIVKLSL